MDSEVGCLCSFNAEIIPCNETETVRLSTFNNDSRLEVCSDGHWNSVCYNYYAYIPAAAVCREVGHAGRGWLIHIHIIIKSEW